MRWAKSFCAFPKPAGSRQASEIEQIVQPGAQRAGVRLRSASSFGRETCAMVRCKRKAVFGLRGLSASLSH